MKTLLFYLVFLFSLIGLAQENKRENLVISEPQNDDAYYSGETLRTEAPIKGDLVIAGGKITIKDSIHQDLLVAGGELIIEGHVADDIRAAGGKLTIDSEVGDDVIVAGGEIYVTKNAIIHGNLINFSGNIKMNGKVLGLVKSYSGEMEMNGSIAKEAYLFGEEIIINGPMGGTSKIRAENIEIGKNAKFKGNVTYWSEDEPIDFKNSLQGVKASFDASLMANHDEFSFKNFGIAALVFWVFYLLSAFLIILLLNWSFQNLFTSVVENFDKHLAKSTGYGLIYIFGLPLVILITLVTIIGIPVGVFIAGFYLFSLLFGHLVTGLLLSHYLNIRGGGSWNFWTIAFLALGIAAVIRFITFIPFLGGLISIAVIAVGYGLIIYTLIQKRIALKLGR